MANLFSIKKAYLITGLILFAWFTAGTLVSAEVTVKEEKVYYGNVKEYTSPAQLELSKVLDATKELQRIKKEKIGFRKRA